MPPAQPEPTQSGRGSRRRAGCPSCFLIQSHGERIRGNARWWCCSLVPPSLSGLLCCRASIIVYSVMACKCFFYIPIPVLPPLPIALPVGGVRSLPAWLAGAATVSAALLEITAGQRQQGRTAPEHPAAALRAERRRGCRGYCRGVRWSSNHHQPVTAFHQADGGKW